MGSWETESINSSPLLSSPDVPSTTGAAIQTPTRKDPQFPTRCKVTIPGRWTLVVDKAIAIGSCATFLAATYLRHLIQTFHPKLRKDRQLFVNPHDASLCLDGWSLDGHEPGPRQTTHVLPPCRRHTLALSLVTCSGPQRDSLYSLFDSQISMTFTQTCSL
jgi:hypothetical protein